MKTWAVTAGRTVFAVAMTLAALTAPAAADAVDDYSALRTAQTLDDLCHALKFVERKAIDQVAWRHLTATSQYSMWQTDRMDKAQYSAWLDDLNAAADAKANEIGCTPPAEAFLIKARGVASSEILQGLLFAQHLASLPEDDAYHRPLTPDKAQAIAGYQNFLQQINREQFPAFFEYTRQQAAARLPEAAKGLPPCSYLTPPDEPCYDSFGGALDDEVYERMYEIISNAWVAEDVLFEVSSEVAGYRVGFGMVEKVHVAATLRHPADWSLYATVLDAGRRFKLDGGGEVYGVIAEREGRLRFMTYGTEAETLRNGAVRLLVRTGPKPENLADWEIYNFTEFRSLTSPFSGALLSEKCLGGPCFEFPAEANQALLATGFDEKAELWLSASADASPAATGDWVHRNTFYPQMFFEMNGKSRPQ